MRKLTTIGFGLLLVHCQIGKVWEGVGGILQTTGAGTSSGSTAGGIISGGSSSGDFGASGGSGDFGSTSGAATSTLISPDAPGCGRGEVAGTTIVPVHFLFTIDRSGSMDDESDAAAQNRVTKWVALQTAMEALFLDMGTDAAAGDDSVAVGVNYFSESDDTSGPDAGKETYVEEPIAALTQLSATALSYDISQRKAGGTTPTRAALAESYVALAAYQPTGALANGNKVVVLVSDGLPNPADPTIPDYVGSEFTGTPSIRTFSVGVGELGSGGGQYGYDPTFMSSIAEDGGTGKAGCDPTNATDPTKFCHFQITPSVSGSNITADFEAAFASIRQQAASCQLKLNIQDPADLEPRAVVVVYQTGTTQTILSKDPVNGWTFDNDTHPTLIRLNGQDCQMLQADPSAEVFAILGCVCGTTTGPGASTAGGTGGGEGAARDEGGTGGSTSGGGFNTDWCSYPFASSAGGGSCSGEGCPTP
jgi:hypothetical protein